jgi:hypothetical protein
MQACHPDLANYHASSLKPCAAAMHTLRFLIHSRPGSFLLIGWALATFLIPTLDHDVIAATRAADASRAGNGLTKNIYVGLVQRSSPGNPIGIDSFFSP